MIKQIFVAICDICGASEKAVASGNQRDKFYELPKGWKPGIGNTAFCICPACWNKVKPGPVMRDGMTK